MALEDFLGTRGPTPSFFGGGLQAPSALPPQIPQLPEEEDQQSILGRLGGMLLGGAANIGSIFTKPGRVVRGLLGFNPRELLNIIPFSDTLGLTRPEQEVTGRSLLEGVGLLAPNEKGLDMGDVAGFGVDVLTDPLTYINPFAPLTKTGLAAKEAGLLLPKMGQRIAEGQQSLLNFGLPGAESLALGTGPISQKIAGGIDKVSEAIGNSQAGLAFSAAFERGARGANTVFGREFGRTYTQLADQALDKASESGIGWAEKLAEAGMNTPEGEKLLKQGLENVIDRSTLPQAAQDFINFREVKQAEQFAKAKELGIDLGEWKSKYGVEFAPRTAAGPIGEEEYLLKQGSRLAGGATSVKGTKIPTNELFDVPGGTAMVNDIASDPQLAKTVGGLGERSAYVRKQYLKWTDDTIEKYTTLRDEGYLKMSLEDAMKDPVAMANRDLARTLDAEVRQSKKLAQWAEGLDDGYRQTGKGPFSSSVIHESMKWDSALDRINLAGEKVHEALASNAVLGKQEGYISALDALERTGLANGKEKLAEFLTKSGLIKDVSELKNVHVPEDTVKALVRSFEPYRAPEWMKPAVRLFDWMTNMFKGNVYAPWLASGVRDFTGQLFMNITEFGKNIANLPGRYKTAWQLLEGKPITGISEDLARQYAREAVASGAVQRGGMSAGEIIGGATHAPSVSMNDILRGIPGRGQKLGEAFASYIPKSKEEAFAFWKQKGVGSFKEAVKEGKVANEDVFSWVRGGRNTKEYGDVMNRMALWIELREQGLAAEEVAKRVKAAHIDFSNLTDFERTWAKRAVPFYTFTRHMLPYTFQELVNKPGGLWSTLLKGEYRIQQQQPYTPEYLTQGLSIPIGGENPETGKSRYLTTLGLPFESPLELFRSGPGALQRNAMGALGQLNPLIKGPLEFATGKQFFSGRDLSDLYGVTGIPYLDQLIANTPASRLASTISMISNPNKSLSAKATNLLTGARLTDVDMEKATNFTINQAVERAMKDLPGARTVSSTYVPKDLQDQLTQDQLEILGLQRARAAAARRKTQ